MNRFQKAWRWARGKDALYPEAWAAPGPSTMPWGFSTPGLDLPEALGLGDGSRNSVVMACLNLISASFMEAPIEVVDRGETEEEDEPVRGHRLPELWDHPNPLMIGELLGAYVTDALHIDGNAYLWKAKSGAGTVAELWPLLPHMMEPIGTDRQGERGFGMDGEALELAPNQYLAGYRYNPGQREVLIPKDDVIHFRSRLDPDNPRRGQAPLKAVLREIYGDEAASQFAAALLKNTGVAAFVIRPPSLKDLEGSEVQVLWGETQAAEMAAQVEERIGGANRGRVLAFPAPLAIDRLSFNPRELDLTDLRKVPETRICGVLGVHPILAGMASGIDMSSGRNELQGMMEFFTERKIVPLWRLVSSWLTHQLLDDMDSAEARRVRFNTTGIRALAEDRTAISERTVAEFHGGVRSFGESRLAVGLTEVPEVKDFYVLPATLLPMPLEALGEPVEEPAPAEESPNGEVRVEEEVSSGT